MRGLEPLVMVLETTGLPINRHPYMEQDTGFEPALMVWKTIVLTANTNPAYGTPGGIRTRDLQLRRRLLYPTELQAYIQGTQPCIIIIQ